MIVLKCKWDQYHSFAQHFLNNFSLYGSEVQIIKIFHTYLHIFHSPPPPPITLLTSSHPSQSFLVKLPLFLKINSLNMFVPWDYTHFPECSPLREVLGASSHLYSNITISVKPSCFLHSSTSYRPSYFFLYIICHCLHVIYFTYLFFYCYICNTVL